MSNEQMTYRDLLELVELIKSSSDFKEFHLKMGDLEVDLARGSREANDAPPTQVSSQAQRAQRPGAPAGASSSQPSNGGSKEDAHRQRHGHIGGGELVVEPQTPQSGGPTGAGAHTAPLGYPPGAVLIKSPMVGTFYRAPEPGARPFVEVGQTVEADTTVCIIEVMKLMNSIPAERKGTVTHILVEDGDPVEYGQVLMVLDPD